MKRGRIWAAAALSAACSILLLSGCSKTEAPKVEGLDKLGAITAVTREDDSGTRASFDDLVGGLIEADSLTVAGSTEEMLKTVAEDPSAIGYLTLNGADGSVKVLTVDGRESSDQKYPLTRQCYLVYKGEPSDLAKEFITYATGKGQEVIGQSFETVGKSDTFLSLKPKGTLQIGGSSSVAPVMEEVAKAYMAENPNADITVTTTDSGDGINGALDGTYDLGMSSRSPKDYEKELLTFTAVAKDRIAVIVQKDNPLEDISKSALENIYSGKTAQWADLG